MADFLLFLISTNHDHKFTLSAGGALTLALIAGLAGCHYERIAPETPEPVETAAQASTNRELAAVAKALARTLGTDAAARQHLKTEALQ